MGATKIKKQAECRKSQKPETSEVKFPRQIPEGAALLEGARFRAMEQQRPYSRHEQRGSPASA